MRFIPVIIIVPVASVAELADAQDLGSCTLVVWRFESSRSQFSAGKVTHKQGKVTQQQSRQRQLMPNSLILR